jgi:hypothetical protein
LHPYYGGLAVRRLVPRKKLSRVQRLACLGIMGVMRNTLTSAVEALICLPPMELVVQNEARSAVYHLQSLGSCLTYIPIEDIAVY